MSEIAAEALERVQRRLLEVKDPSTTRERTVEVLEAAYYFVAMAKRYGVEDPIVRRLFERASGLRIVPLPPAGQG